MNYQTSSLLSNCTETKISVQLRLLQVMLDTENQRTVTLLKGNALLNTLTVHTTVPTPPLVNATDLLWETGLPEV